MSIENIFPAKLSREFLGALTMEAACTSETSVNLYQTARRNNSEDSHLHTCRCENLKPHRLLGCSTVYSRRYRPRFQSCLLPPKPGRWISRAGKGRLRYRSGPDKAESWPEQWLRGAEDCSEDRQSKRANGRTGGPHSGEMWIEPWK
jgi:hypothetical protein